MADEKPKKKAAKAEQAETVSEPEAPVAPAAATPEPAAEEPQSDASAEDMPTEAEKVEEAVEPGEAEPLPQPAAAEAEPEHVRGRRVERRGVVVSSTMDKTIVVKVDTVKAHPRYKKVVRRSTKFHAHDEGNQAKIGDVVRIVESRPLSKTKSWRLVEILE